MRPPWQVIAEAWEPFLGASVAEERARNAETVLRHLEELTPESVTSTLSRILMMARLPEYGSVALNGSTVIDAVHAAVKAMADEESKAQAAS